MGPERKLLWWCTPQLPSSNYQRAGGRSTKCSWNPRRPWINYFCLINKCTETILYDICYRSRLHSRLAAGPLIEERKFDAFCSKTRSLHRNIRLSGPGCLIVFEAFTSRLNRATAWHSRLSICQTIRQYINRKHVLSDRGIRWTVSES